MTSSWTSTADSNIYKRGQVVNLQVSAEMRPDEQLFIQSCFVSASPEPQTRPRHAVIMNKGCTSPLGSPHAVVQFVVSNKADVVNFILNTSNLISELYIHCSVLISDQGVTSGSKSCNYNLDADVMTERGANDRPIIRSKLEFSKGSDGSQSLSYEEEVVKQQEETKRKPKHGLKGMRSTFLQLLRRMDKAE
ncbi:zona pellucida protein C [Acanthochromis polyacanthus]|uniref:zona pellucida protein C n=1 Tax=Acanthochromis polyacanthus TaxID=80966 RepID=UPI002234AC5C|nr:zona pellucida protein C [Acanthochromis polyacanthus]